MNEKLVDKRMAKSFISWPEAPFFLRHTVTMNMAGKVYAVLRCIEEYSNVDDLQKGLFATYAVCMLLGMYWYTRFWLGDNLISFYYDSDHALNKWQIPVLIGAAIYYVIFGSLFAAAYSAGSNGVALSLCLWNFWCAVNLCLSIPLYQTSTISDFS